MARPSAVAADPDRDADRRIPGCVSARNPGRVVEERRFKRRVSKSRGRASAPVARPGLKADGCGGRERGPEGPLFHNPAPRHGCTKTPAMQLVHNPSRGRRM